MIAGNFAATYGVIKPTLPQRKRKNPNADDFVSEGLESGRVQSRIQNLVGERPTERKDSTLVAWETSWCESEAAKLSDNTL
jgi:hypothetical protein